MQSFRTELENSVVEKDIIELEKKIRLHKEGKIDDDKFRSLRLARGIYGQRQPGVQMIRIKIPFGRMTAHQLRIIADLSDEYASSNLHATTRQDIQIHYVSLDRTPELWEKLEQEDITLREACGNAVRNITASAKAGIDPEEPFDVSPYAQAFFKHFLRNPMSNELGRKFKIAFSATENDSAFTLIHDVGLIAKLKTDENGKEVRGFKVVIGGGLGANPYLAETAFEFLHEDEVLPFTEALIRVFGRFGERKRRQKARLKFLLQDLGLQGLLDLVKAEFKANQFKSFKIDRDALDEKTPQAVDKIYPKAEIQNPTKYENWLKSNVFAQKQKGLFGVFLKVQLGDISSETARKLAQIVDDFASDDIRVTINQGYLLRGVRKEAFEALFVALDELKLAEPGFDSVADITACPGTDTCNLGISSSTGIAKQLEKVITEEYPDLIFDHKMKIKISGCPNSCGQHGIATIGFHGSSVKNGAYLLPALQVLLGGNVGLGAEGRIAEKVIKIPSKRGPEALRTLLEDYEDLSKDGEYFSDYYVRQGKMYFYHLLKPLANLESLTPTDYLDWGHTDAFQIEKAVGECAGVIIDLVATLLYETEEKIDFAHEAFAEEKYSDAIFHAYSVFVNGAKAILTGTKAKTNTQTLIIKNFSEQVYGKQNCSKKKDKLLRSECYKSKKMNLLQSLRKPTLLMLRNSWKV